MTTLLLLSLWFVFWAAGCPFGYVLWVWLLDAHERTKGGIRRAVLWSLIWFLWIPLLLSFWVMFNVVEVIDKATVWAMRRRSNSRLVQWFYEGD